jgi:UDP-N-acetylglucosamine 4,6-dehydratase
MLNKKNILITGATGTFGKSIVRFLLKNYKPNKIIIFSRDELKQHDMQKSKNFGEIESLRYFLGDIRDLDRLKTAMNKVDVVIHAAALKHVPAAEYNPEEFIKTNIHGSENVIKAAIYNNVSKVIALSTDKAVQPLNLYGATKLVAEKLFIAANNMYGDKKTKFSVARYGNVVGSRGSIVPLYKELIKKGHNILPVTHKDMTRFWITKKQAVEFVINILMKMNGGEIFIPKLPSIKIVDLAKAMGNNIKIKYIGKRPGEKLHEILCLDEESPFMYELNNYYVIKEFFTGGLKVTKSSKNKYKNSKLVKPGFIYSSGNNKIFLKKEKIIKFNTDDFDDTL